MSPPCACTSALQTLEALFPPSHGNVAHFLPAQTLVLTERLDVVLIEAALDVAHHQARLADLRVAHHAHFDDHAVGARGVNSTRGPHPVRWRYGTHLLFSTSPMLPTLAPLCVRERAVCPPGASSMLNA
jgi:hypothetical protein